MYAIIGANGFIGRHLCTLLDQKKIKYKAISRKKVIGYESVGDINRYTNWDMVLKNVHTIFHFASKAHVFNINSNQYIESINEDIKGIKRLAFEASRLGVKRFIYLSSIKVCGEHTPNMKFFSNLSPQDPKDLYSKSKAKTEIILKKVSNETGLEIVIIRPPLVYGPGVKANFLSLLNLANNKLPLPLAGINNKRSIIYVGNLVDFVYECALRNEAIGKTFLIADPNPISTSELIRMISISLNKRIVLFEIPKIILFLMFFLIGKKNIYNKLFLSLVIDSNDTYKDMNWRPKTSLEEALQITAKWYLLKNKE